MKTCPKCQKESRQVKAGKTPHGSQRYKCQHCQCRYTPDPQETGYPEAMRHRALELYLEGINFRRIARLLKVSHTSVMNWIKAAADQLPDELPLPEQVMVIEEDELFTFVQHKKTKPTSSP
jgi:transposase-like protein